MRPVGGLAGRFETMTPLERSLVEFRDAVEAAVFGALPALDVRRWPPEAVILLMGVAMIAAPALALAMIGRHLAS